MRVAGEYGKFSALGIASRAGHSEIVKLPLEKEFETRRNGYDFLRSACLRGYNSIVLDGHETSEPAEGQRKDIAELPDASIIGILVDMNRKTDIEALLDAAKKGRDDIIKILMMETFGINIRLLDWDHSMEALLTAPKDARSKVIDTLIHPERTLRYSVRGPQ